MMFDAQSAFANELEMLDGAVCHFMGSDVATITQKDEEGQGQSITLEAEAMRQILAAEQDGAVGAVSYRFTGGDAVALHNAEEPDSSVVVMVEDLENALAAMAN